MSKTRKILSLLVAVVMVFGVFSICAFAADETYTPTDKKSDNSFYTQEWSLSTPVDNKDGTWSVNVNLKTDYGVGGIQFKLDITGNATLKEAVKLTALPDYYGAPQITAKKDGVMLVPVSGSGNSKDSSVINGDILKLTFTVTGSATVGIKNDPKGTSGASVGGSLIAFRTANLAGSDMIVGQKVTVGAAVTMGATATPKLVVKEGTGGVIDTTRTAHMTEDGTKYTVDGLLYGVEVVDIGETIADVFDVKNGTMNVVENDAGSDCGTGAKVEVLDDSGEVVATYIFILFGDIDGDGEIGSGDSALVEAHDGYSYDEDGRIDDSIVLFAGDLDADEEVGSGDAALIEAHDGYSYDSDTSRMSQAEIAELYAPVE